MGEEPERGGVPSEVDPARGPARRATGTQGTGRREPLKTTGTRPRALRGRKGGSRAFGRHPRDKGGGRGPRGGGPGGRRRAETSQEGLNSRAVRRGRSRGCRTLGTC